MHKECRKCDLSGRTGGTDTGPSGKGDAKLEGEAWREYRNAIDMEFFYSKGKYSVTEICCLTGQTRNIYSWMSDPHNDAFVYSDGTYREVSCEYKSDYYFG